MRARPVIAVVAAAFLSIALSAVALAHARLRESDPAAGATITTPYTLRTTFNEAIDTQSFVSVVNAADEEVARGSVSAADDKTMIAELPALPAGTYTVRWLAHTSDDNATQRGEFTFNVGAVATAAPTPAPNGGQGGQAGNSGDLLIALVVAAIGLAGIGTFIAMRMRR